MLLNFIFIKLQLDIESAKLVAEAAEVAKSVLSARDNNFVPSLVFLFLSVGVLQPFSQEIGHNTYLYIIELLSDVSWSDYITSHPRIGDILLPFADLLAVLRDPTQIRQVSSLKEIYFYCFINDILIVFD